MVTYMRLGTACTNFFRSLKQNRVTDGLSISLESFFNRFKKGSRPIRNQLCKAKFCNINVLMLNNVLTYSRLIDIQLDIPPYWHALLESWNFSFFPNQVREFAFKSINNCLGLNVRLSHFVPGASRLCSFCTLSDRNTLNEETYLHLFFSCPYTNGILRQFELVYFDDLILDTEEKRKRHWLLGQSDVNDTRPNIFILASLWVIKFLVWECKLKKKKSSFLTMKIEFLDMLNRMYDSSRLIRDEQGGSNKSLCRNWYRHRRG